MSDRTITAGLWENRIVGFDPAVDPGQLLAHPDNPWSHPEAQTAQLRGVLGSVGWWDAVKVNVTTGHVVDGHARIMLALREGQPSVPVLYVAMSEEDERVVLATHNQIARMALPNVDSLDGLIAQIRTDGVSQRLAGVIDRLATTFGLLPGMDGPGDRALLRQDPRAPAPPGPRRDTLTGEAMIPGVRPDPEAPLLEDAAGGIIPAAAAEQLATLAGHRTARRRREPSDAIRAWASIGLLQPPVLDYGSGLDPHDYPRFDPAYDPDYGVFRQRWKTIVCSFVLNVIPLRHSRVELLAALRGMLWFDGCVLVAVPDPASYRPGPREFQAAWTPDQWERMFAVVFGTVEAYPQIGDFWAWRLTPETST